MVKSIVSIELTPEELAEEFSRLDSYEQARFYNHLAKIGSNWFDMQLQYITEEEGLTLSGRRVMQSIGDYSHWGLVCNLSKQAREWLWGIKGE